MLDSLLSDRAELNPLELEVRLPSPPTLDDAVELDEEPLPGICDLPVPALFSLSNMLLPRPSPVTGILPRVLAFRPTFNGTGIVCWELDLAAGMWLRPRLAESRSDFCWPPPEARLGDMMRLPGRGMLLFACPPLATAGGYFAGELGQLARCCSCCFCCCLYLDSWKKRLRMAFKLPSLISSGLISSIVTPFGKKNIKIKCKSIKNKSSAINKIVSQSVLSSIYIFIFFLFLIECYMYV